MDEKDTSLPMDDDRPFVDGPTIQEPEPEAGADKEARERDESGRFKAKEKGEKQEEAPPASEPENVPVKALQEERRKRQELEQMIAQLQQQHAQQNAEPPPSVFEDEERWQQHFGNNVVSQAVQTATLNARLDMSEMMAAKEFEDFDTLKAEFLKMAEQNPELRQQALSDPHPWAKAAQIAQNARTMRELGATSIDDLRKSIRAEIEAELRANAPRFPTSTAHDGSVSSRGGPVWSGITPDKDLLPMG